MSDSKIEFSYDNLHFACEGDKDWVEAQLNQVLSRIPGLNAPAPAVKKETAEAEVVQIDEAPKTPEVKEVKGVRGRKPKVVVETTIPEPAGDPLYEFLKEKKADKNQVKKFLATAVFLHAQGDEKFSTPLISKTLKSAGLEKLVNASDCLNKNEKKGFCIKDDKEFILTDLGVRSILGGIEE
jgi:hypothetical protein